MVIFFKEIFSRFSFWKNADRLGPDIPINHWKLYFPITMKKLCKRKFASFADSSEFRPGAYAIGCSKINIGKRVVIRPSTMLFADSRENGNGIVIEDDVMLGSGVHIYTHNHSFENPNIPIIDQGYTDSVEIIIGKGSWIGANAIITAGVTVGKHAVVGAGSIVTKSIPERAVAVGSPAKVIRIIGE